MLRPWESLGSCLTPGDPLQCLGPLQEVHSPFRSLSFATSAVLLLISHLALCRGHPL